MKVIIADDQKLLRDCLKFMIEKNSDIHVIACAENGLEAVDLATQLQPDLILMDIKMPHYDGIEATKRIKQLNRNIKVLMLTTSQNNTDVEIAIKNGADGYVLKSISSEELIMAIRSVHMGLEIIQKDVFQATFENKNQNEKGSAKNTKNNDIHFSLSNRDLQIIRLIAEGKTTAEIAQELYLTEGRVRNIITEIIGKLSLNDRAQLVAYAYKNHLI